MYQRSTLQLERMKKKRLIQTLTAAVRTAVMTSRTHKTDFDFLEIHASEKTRVEKFYEETCHCKLAADEKPCSTTLKIDDFVDCRNNCSELSSTELYLVILGAFQCSLNCNETSTSGRAEKNRQYTRMGYYYHGHRMCMRTLKMGGSCTDYFS